MNSSSTFISSIHASRPAASAGRQKSSLYRSSLAVALALVCLCAASQANAATITVNSVCTLNRAVHAINRGRNTARCTAASGTYGVADKINVPAGTFTFPATLHIQKTMEIAGAQGWPRTEITPSTESLSSAIEVTDPEVQLKLTSLVLLGPLNNTTTGIHVETGGDFPSPGSVWLVETRVRAFNDSGIHIRGGAVMADNSFINQNFAPFDGGGVRLTASPDWGPSRFQSNNTRIDYNYAGRFGGGIYNQDGVVELDNGYFLANHANVSGGAIYAVFNHTGISAYTNIKNSSPGTSFSFNSAASGGYSIRGGNMTVTFHAGIGVYGNTTPLCAPNVGCPPT